MRIVLLSGHDSEQITVSLEWAKKLKEAGWPQNSSLFWWAEFYNKSSTTPDELFQQLVDDDEWDFGSINVMHGFRESGYLKQLKRLSVPTAEEILQRLPMNDVTLTGDGRIFCCTYDKGFTSNDEVGDNLANAAAAMFCYLAERKLLRAA